MRSRRGREGCNKSCAERECRRHYYLADGVQGCRAAETGEADEQEKRVAHLLLLLGHAAIAVNSTCSLPRRSRGYIGSSGALDLLQGKRGSQRQVQLHLRESCMLCGFAAADTNHYLSQTTKRDRMLDEQRHVSEQPAAASFGPATPPPPPHPPPHPRSTRPPAGQSRSPRQRQPPAAA